MSNTTQVVGTQLFAEPAGNLFAVLDGASVADLREKLHLHRPEHECLFDGELEPDMAQVAPYLVRLEPNTEFSDWLIGQGWGKHWGVFAVASADLRALYQHFRKFLIVYGPDGQPLRFRYYDPRVLRIYLPTCNAEELRIVFGPVAAYLLEGEEPDTLLRFRMTGGALRQDERRLERKES